MKDGVQVAESRWDVFLSYSHKNERAASIIARDLSRFGFRVWKDTSEITAGKRMRSQISEGIMRCRTVVALMSVHSLRSPWCLQELDSAMTRELEERRTVVIPVLLGSVHNDMVPIDLRGKRFIDLRRNFSAAYASRRHELISALRIEADKDAHGIVPLGVLGVRAIAHLMSIDYKNQHLDGMGNEVWDSMIHTFWSASSRSTYNEEIAWFKNEYGQQAVRSVLAYFFDLYEVPLHDWFTEAAFDRAANGAELFMVMVVTSMWAVSNGKPPVEYGIDSSGEVVYGLSRPGLELNH